MEGKRDAPSHDMGTRKGEEMPGGSEAGRHERGTTQTGRPRGTSSARDYTGINPQDREPIDPSMPHLTEA